MRPFKSKEISRSEWDSGRKWAVCTTPKASKVVHEFDDFVFFFTRAEARAWIAAQRSPRASENNFSRVLAALLCAEADLRGILPDYDPDGTHPARQTLRDLKAAIDIAENQLYREV